MNRCQQTESLLSTFLEGETSPAETRFLQSHLASCPRCRHDKTEVESLLTRLHSLPRIETSAGFTERVLARTSGLEPAGIEVEHVVAPVTSRFNWSVPMAAAAAVLVMVWGVSQLRSGATPEGEMAMNSTPPVVETAPVTDLADPAGDPLASNETTGGTVPEVQTLGGDESRSVWLDGDAYVLENYELREPAGGGSPTLTRTSGDADKKVVVTF